jgi:hypothetical protein
MDRVVSSPTSVIPVSSSCLQHKRKKEETFRILQEPGSLLITTDCVYGDYLHGIEEVTIDKDLNENTIANWSLLADPERWAGAVLASDRTSDRS